MEDKERQPTNNGGGIIRKRSSADASSAQHNNNAGNAKTFEPRNNENTLHTADEVILTSQRPRPTTQVSFKLRRSHRQVVESDDDIFCEKDDNGENDQSNTKLPSKTSLTGSAPHPTTTTATTTTETVPRPRRHRTNSHRRNLFTHLSPHLHHNDRNHNVTNPSVSPPNSPPPTPRRKNSFRGRERKGDTGIAGGMRRVWRALFAEQAKNVSSALELSLHAVGSLGNGSKSNNNEESNANNATSMPSGEGQGGKDDNDDNNPDALDSSLGLYQYYIPPPEEANNRTCFHALGKLYTGAFSDLTMWLYGASLLQVLLFFLVLYFIFIYFFVVLLFLVDWHLYHGRCIQESPDDPFETGEISTRAALEFAFELSWTTFTTVGYGSIAPPDDNVDCYPVRLICSIEAILGVGFVSCCSGIFYAKLMRMLAEAPVTFSSTLCVQYGKGLEDSGKRYGPVSKQSFADMTWARDELDDGLELEDSDATINAVAEAVGKATVQRPQLGVRRFHPFPVIEFRIVNNRANCAPGRNEIWDAQVTAIVQLLVEDDPHGEEDDPSEDFDASGNSLNDLSASVKSTRWYSSGPPADDDDVSERKNRKVYYTLEFKPAFHPYFNRIWFLRHTLDTSSPLLRREVRTAIKARGKDAGWDPTLNNYNDIRACLVEFNSLRIIMNGASALSKSEVYAEKVYTYDDICVGWQFVGICYDVAVEDDEDEKSNSSLCSSGWKALRHCSKGERKARCFEDRTRVDLSLIHDIVPQRGGDFEPVETQEDMPEE